MERCDDVDSKATMPRLLPHEIALMDLEDEAMVAQNRTAQGDQLPVPSYQ